MHDLNALFKVTYAQNTTGDAAGNLAASFERSFGFVAVTSQETVDVDGDGWIDAIHVTFSSPINDGTFDPGDWDVSGVSGEYFDPGTLGDEPNDADIYLSFDDGVLDSGVVPVVTYNQRTLADVFGNPVASMSGEAWWDRDWRYRRRINFDHRSGSENLTDFPVLVSLDELPSAVSLEQWASEVIDFSSQYSSGSWSAAQALGPPDTFQYGDFSTTWQGQTRNGSIEFLSVGFADPVFATDVVIRETYGNGFVRRVELIDVNDQLHEVFNGVDDSETFVPFDFTVSFPKTDYLVKGVKITTDTDHDLNAWESVDAVKLIGDFVDESQSFDFSKANPNGSDIRFVDADGTLLDHEIESWDADAESASVWVRVPQVDAGGRSGDFVYLYHGNRDATDAQNAAGVWSNDYTAVWHLNEPVTDDQSDGIHYDSLGVHHGMQRDNQGATGIVAGGQVMDGAGDYVEVADHDQLSFGDVVTDRPFSLSAWVNPDADGGYLVSKDSASGVEYGLWQDDSGFLHFQLADDDGDQIAVQSTTAIPTGAWQYVTATYDGSRTAAGMRLYLGDTPLSTGDISSGTYDGAANNAASLRIGSSDRSGSAYDLDGTIDEVRIANAVRSPTWVAASYRSQTGTDTFIDFGGTEIWTPATVDRASPVLRTSETVDLNADGFADAIHLTYSEAIDDATISAADWEIGLVIGESFSSTTGGDTANDADFYISFVDGLRSLDAKLDVTYTPGATADPDGNPIDGLQRTIGSISVISKETADLDGDGWIDAIHVTFSDPIDDATVDVADWDVAGVSGESFDSLTSGDTPGDADIYITFEDGVFDTSGAPELTYTRGEIRDSLGVLARSSGGQDPVTVDAVAPLLLDGQPVDLNGDGFLDAIHLTYSEPINDATISAADWEIAGVTGESFSSTTNGDTADDADFYITFDDGVFALNSKFEVTFTQRATADFAGNLAEGFQRWFGNISVISKETADLNGDGWIDAIHVTFSDAILDGTVPRYSFDVAGVENEYFSSYTSGDLPNDDDIYITFDDQVLDTSALPDLAIVEMGIADALGILVLPSTAQDPPTVDRAPPVLRDGQPFDLDNDGFLDAIRLTYSEPIDDATILASDWDISGVTGESFSSTTDGDTANDADFYITFNDGVIAADEFLEVRYVQNATADPAGNLVADLNQWFGDIRIVSKETADLDGDGWIDAVHITFSHPIDDSTLAWSDWDVEGVYHRISSTTAGDTEDDADIYLTFDDHLWDSGFLPDLTFTQRRLAGPQGVLVKSSDAQDPATVDRAAPVLREGQPRDLDGDGFLDAIQLTYSEAIDDATILAADWDVRGVTGESFSSTTDGDTPNDSDFYITFDDGVIAADEFLEVNYVQNATADPAGNLVADLNQWFGEIKIVSKETADLDGDGWVDAIHITFSHPIDDSTVELYSNVVSISSAYLRRCCSLRRRTGDTENDDGHLPDVRRSQRWDSGFDPWRDVSIKVRLVNALGILVRFVGRIDDPATVDRVPPVLRDGQPHDLDGDGFFDALQLTFSEPIDDSTILAADWDIVGVSGESFSSTTEGDTADDEYFYLTFDDGVFSTDALLNVIHTQNVAADAAGNLVPDLDRWFGEITITSKETADLDADGFIDAIHITFSHPISDETVIDFLAGEEGAFDDLEGSFDVAGVSGEALDRTTSLDTPNDADIYLTFDDGVLDTAATPEVIYNEAFQVFNEFGVPVVDTLGPLLATVDRAKPVLLSGEPVDLDRDGSLDAIHLIYSEPIKDSTISAGDWYVGGVTGEAFSATTNDDTPDDVDFYLTFDDGVLRRGTEPSLIYVENSTTDLVGNPLAGFKPLLSVSFDDRAPSPLVGEALPRSGVFQTEQSLATLGTSGPNGTWTLEVFDEESGTDAGSHLLEWSLDFQGSWDPYDSGEYRISTVAQNVRSANGQLGVESREIGSFDVRIDDPHVIYVDTFADTPTGDSLRDAIIAANAAAPDPVTIILGSGTYRMEIPAVVDPASTFPFPDASSGCTSVSHASGWSDASTGDFDITGNVTILGDATTQTILDAEGLDRVFKVSPQGSLTLKDLTVTGGVSRPDQGGGGILSAGQLELDHVNLSGNEAIGDVWAIGGGGVALWGGAAQIVDSTLEGNSADVGGALFVCNAATAEIAQSTLSHNQALRGGGVASIRGAAISLANTTLSRNTGGAIDGSMGLNLRGEFHEDFAAAPILVNHVTAAFNVGEATFVGPVRFQNTLMTANETVHDAGAGTVSLGQNVLDRAVVPLQAVDTVNTSGQQQVSTLQPIQTGTFAHLPTSGSLAINPCFDCISAGWQASDEIPFEPFDQRGAPRTIYASSNTSLAVSDSPSGAPSITSDIGAVEAIYGSVSGTVFLDRNRNSIRDADEPGLSGFTIFGGPDGTNVTVSQADNPLSEGEIETGRYSFPFLQAGTHEILPQLPDDWQYTRSAVERIAGLGIEPNNRRSASTAFRLTEGWSHSRRPPPI